MNILVVFTGGTIGSSLQEQNLSPDTKASYSLIEEHHKHYPNSNTSFSTLSPFNILSENMQPSDWTTLIESIDDYN